MTTPKSERAWAVLTIAVFLCGCEDQETARARNEEKLPLGCRIIDLDYGDLRAAVVCEGRKTTTSLRSWDETIYVYDANLKMTMPQTYRRRSLSAEVGASSPLK